MLDIRRNGREPRVLAPRAVIVEAEPRSSQQRAAMTIDPEVPCLERIVVNPEPRSFALRGGRDGLAHHKGMHAPHALPERSGEPPRLHTAHPVDHLDTLGMRVEPTRLRIADRPRLYM